MEYLTTTEAAELLRIKRKSLTNMKGKGVFREGVHFFRRPGLGPRWKRDALVHWLEDSATTSEDVLPLAQSGGNRLGH